MHPVSDRDKARLRELCMDYLSTLARVCVDPKVLLKLLDEIEDLRDWKLRMELCETVDRIQESDPSYRPGYGAQP